MKHLVSKFTSEVDLETIDTTVLRDIISAYKTNLTDKVIEYTLCLRLNSATLFNNIYLGLLTISPSEIDTGEIVDILDNLKDIEWQHEDRVLGIGITFDAFDPYECDEGCICSSKRE